MSKSQRFEDLDDVSAELARLQVMTDLVWDFATDISPANINDMRLVERVFVLAGVTRDMASRLQESFVEFHDRSLAEQHAPGGELEVYGFDKDTGEPLRERCADRTA